LEGLSEETDVAYSGYSVSVCKDALREIMKKSLRIACVSVEIRTEHLPNTNQELFVR
jgi:hypothetical protein